MFYLKGTNQRNIKNLLDLFYLLPNPQPTPQIQPRNNKRTKRPIQKPCNDLSRSMRIQV